MSLQRWHGLVATLLLAIPLGCVNRGAPPAAELQPDVVLLAEPVDLGRTVRGGLAFGTIRIRAGASGARIVRVDPSCGCTTVEVRLPVELPPLATLDIPVTTDLARVANGGARAPGETGPNIVERQVLIESAAHHLVTANVRLEVSELFTLDPPRIDFDRLPPGGMGTASVVLASLSGPAPTVTGITSNEPGLTVVEARLANGSWRIDASLAAPTRMGPVRAEIRVRTDDLREPEVVIPVLALIEPLLAFEPTRVEQMGASTARPVVARIRFQRRDGADLVLRSATTGNHRVRLTFVGDPVGPSASLEVMVPVLPAPEEIRTVLSIDTNVPGQEHLEIPIHVSAAPGAGG